MPARIEELPAGYRAVTPTMDDVARATEFFNLVEISEWGVPDFVESEIEEEWSDLDLEKSVVLVEDESGNYVASMTLEFSNGVTWEAFGYVHPEHQDRGLGTWVVRWSEAMARACEGETRDGYRLAMFNYISTVNGAAQELLTAEGYELQKVFRRMSIELQERPAPPDWPESYELRPFVPDRDQHAYFDAIQTAFAEHWSASPRTFESWSKSWMSENFDPHLLVQVVHANQVVGACCGKPIGDTGWIGYVAIVPEHRRRGLAKRMLQESFGRFWDKGIKRIDLGVDSENRQSAVDLYIGMGMHESHSYESHRKILREGLDWRDEN
jgi:ribosomal protein S18 acetylase RimI-like enzyme